jgi:hypothetical protein
MAETCWIIHFDIIVHFGTETHFDGPVLATKFLVPNALPLLSRNVLPKTVLAALSVLKRPSQVLDDLPRLHIHLFSSLPTATMPTLVVETAVLRKRRITRPLWFLRPPRRPLDRVQNGHCPPPPTNIAALNVRNGSSEWTMADRVMILYETAHHDKACTQSLVRVDRCPWILVIRLQQASRACLGSYPYQPP